MRKQHEGQVVGWDSPVAIHPGEYLEEFLEEFSMSQDELAKRIDLHPKTVNEIIKGKASITNHTALKLSKVFPVSETYWNNLQEIYLSDIARIEDAKKIESEVENHLTEYRETYKELIKHGLVEKYTWIQKNYEEIVRALHKYFGANSLLFVEREFNVGTAFRTYSKNKVNPLTVAAWVRAGERKATTTKVEPFDLKKLKGSLGEMRTLSTKRPEKYLPELERILAECGVVLVYMPYFAQSYAQGAVRWMSKDKVLLMLNASKRSEDKFWFNLFHELGHIILHNKINKEDRSRMYLDLEGAPDSKIEKEADDFAQKQLIPDYETRYKELCGYKDYRKGIVQISKELKVSPAIFAGQIAYHHHERGDNVYGVLSQFWNETNINYSNLESAKNCEDNTILID